MGPKKTFSAPDPLLPSGVCLLVLSAVKAIALVCTILVACRYKLNVIGFIQGKILGSRHRHANDTNLHEKVSLAVFCNRRLGHGLLTCMKKSYENRLRKSVTVTASSRDLKVKPMSYNSIMEDEGNWDCLSQFVRGILLEKKPNMDREVALMP
ncbi:hypothetical protein J6590_050866 [Homalodisca vitripennis]|nr:hypothetical protein J6590_050866 [Homalodisca vitripennis]